MGCSHFVPTEMHAAPKNPIKQTNGRGFVKKSKALHLFA
jgi:hypothetical protein